MMAASEREESGRGRSIRLAVSRRSGRLHAEAHD